MRGLYLFIIWHNAAKKEAAIMQNINKRFEVFRTYEVNWSDKLFRVNLSRFYGKKLPKSCRKEKEVGFGAFKVVLVYDNKQRLTCGKNKKMINAKARYRKLCGGNVIHASDNEAETNENLLFLFGKNIEEIKSERKRTKPLAYKHDLVGAQGWKSQAEVIDFARKISGVEVCESKQDYQFSALDPFLLSRLLNAKKSKWPCSAKYFIMVNGKELPIYIHKSKPQKTK